MPSILIDRHLAQLTGGLLRARTVHAPGEAQILALARAARSPRRLCVFVPGFGLGHELFMHYLLTHAADDTHLLALTPPGFGEGEEAVPKTLDEQAGPLARAIIAYQQDLAVESVKLFGFSVGADLIALMADTLRQALERRFDAVFLADMNVRSDSCFLTRHIATSPDLKTALISAISAPEAAGQQADIATYFGSLFRHEGKAGLRALAEDIVAHVGPRFTAFSDWAARPDSPKITLSFSSEADKGFAASAMQRCPHAAITDFPVHARHFGFLDLPLLELIEQRFLS